jgi:hypothetical protein
MVGPGGAVAGFVICFHLAAGGLHAEEQAEVAACLAHHAGGLGAAFLDTIEGGVGVLDEAEAVLRLFGGGDVEGGDVSLGGVGWLEGRDAGDEGVVAAREVFEGVGWG